jgi:TolB-like protein
VFVLWKRCWRVRLAEERSIRYVLEGSVQKSGDKVRIAIAIYVRFRGFSRQHMSAF